MEKFAHPGAKLEKQLYNALRQSYIDIIRKDKLFLFRDENPKDQIPTFPSILDHTQTTLTKNEDLWTLDYRYKNISNVTKAYLMNGYSKEKPTLIFHHGLSATNHKLHLRVLVDKNFYKLFNVFSIQASNHNSMIDVLDNCVNKFINLTTTVAGSVLLVEEIVKDVKKKSGRVAAVSGFSMGGVVTSWHYLHFDSADIYFPIIAYPNFGEILLDPNHRKHIKKYEEMLINKNYLNCYAVSKDLKDSRSKEKIFPIIGTADALINYANASKFWEGYHTTELLAGHASVVFKRNTLREIVLAKTLKIMEEMGQG